MTGLLRVAAETREILPCSLGGLCGGAPEEVEEEEEEGGAGMDDSGEARVEERMVGAGGVVGETGVEVEGMEGGAEVGVVEEGEVVGGVK